MESVIIPAFIAAIMVMVMGHRIMTLQQRVKQLEKELKNAQNKKASGTLERLGKRRDSRNSG